MLLMPAMPSQLFVDFLLRKYLLDTADYTQLTDQLCAAQSHYGFLLFFRCGKNMLNQFLQSKLSAGTLKCFLSLLLNLKDKKSKKLKLQLIHYRPQIPFGVCTEIQIICKAYARGVTQELNLLVYIHVCVFVCLQKTLWILVALQCIGLKSLYDKK